MKIYHIEFAKIGLGMSGGERCMIELIRTYKSMGIHNVLCTTDNGKKTYESFGIKANKYLSYKIIPSYAQEKKYHIFISYILRTFQALQLIKKLSLKNDDLIICHSEFFPNSIPTFFLKNSWHSSHLIYFYHMIMPRFFYGYEGEFTNKIHLPNFAFIHHKLNQYLYRWLMDKKGIIVSVNPAYEKQLKSLFPHNKTHILTTFGGDKTRTRRSTYKKVYDYLWMGRLAKVKGVPDLLAFIKKLSNEKKKKTMMIIGSGHPYEIADFSNKLQKLNVSSFVSFKTNVYGKAKEDIFQKSKLFLMTSYYESYGLVILEALQHRIPVLAYNLPVYDVFSAGVKKVAIGSVAKLFTKGNTLLKNKPAYEKLADAGFVFGQTKSWDKTAKELLSTITYV